jgi:glycosyltransferase involved in cell wall biosynthesis
MADVKVNQFSPLVSVVVPTYNNRAVLGQCLESWRRLTDGQPVEILVIEDGCTDGTREYLAELSRTEWGGRHLRWFHEDDVHELVCTNRGFAEARGALLVAWQSDMILRGGWFVGELISTFERYKEIGLISLSRGLNCHPLDEPIETWEQLVDWRRLESTIGRRPLNWFRLQEVDAVMRPWVVRRECLDRVGLLDEVFRPTEWDEADLCFRIRRAGWKIATYGYERLGAYSHLGSATVGAISEQYKSRVLANGLTFHRRWDGVIRAEHPRPRRTWVRRAGGRGWVATLKQMKSYALRRPGGQEHLESDS